jgi:hypothetical protein
MGGIHEGHSMIPSKPPMGINVASDTKAGLRYADMIVDGQKTLESRNSDTLRPYVGKRVAIVRTGEGKAKAIGEVTIGEPKVVNQKQFRAMEGDHLVPKGSRFDINTPTKHLYPMHDPVRYEEERDVGHGIVSRKVIHKAKGGAVKPTIEQMRLALAKGGSTDEYFSVLEERDMSNPKYREYLEKQQGLEGSYPETFAAPIARGLSSVAKTAKAIFAPEKQTGQIIKNPIGWSIRVPNKRKFDEPYSYTLPPPAPYVPRAPEEIANQALKRLPERFKDAVMDKAPTNAALSANDLMELARMYKEKEKPQNKAKGGSVAKEPKSTVKAYKLFRVHKDHPGKLFPLFVDANTPVEMNKWVDAKEGDMKDGKVKSKIGALAYRPGWHAGDLPMATHIGEKSDPSVTAPDRRPANHAWAEVEMPNDVDWQAEATKRGTNAQGKLVPVKAHITDQIPKGGHYRYKTNPNMTGNWLIGGSMKVNKVLSDAEVERINKKAGMADLPRTEPFAKKTFGFAQGGTVDGCIAPEEFKAEEYVNYKAKGGKVNPSQHEMRQALLRKASGGVVRMAGGGILQDVIKKPNQLSGVVLSGASWLAGDEKTKLANKAFGQDVTNTAVGGYKTADVLNQLNVFERDGGTFAPGTTVVLDIGANDIATGVDPAITRANLDEIVSRLGENGVNIILSAQPFANSFQEAIDNPNLVMNEMYSDIANNNPNVTLVDAMSGFLNQKNLMDESGFHLNNEQSKADYINKFADAYKANQPPQNVVDTTNTNTNPIGGLTAITPADNVQNNTNQLADETKLVSPLEQASLVEQTPNPPEPIQQASYKMPEYDTESNRSFKNFDDYGGGMMERAEGGEVRSPFDYDNPSHVRNVANIAAKHRDFNQIPDAAKHLAGVLSQGSYKFVEDPRIQSAIKQAGHNGYYIGGKDGKQQIIRKAEGGAVLPIEQVKAQMMNRFKGLNQLQSIGAEEAPSMGIKAYVPTTGSPDAGRMPVGGIDTSQGDLPVGGIDMSKQQPGHQLMPSQPGQQPGMGQVPMSDQPPMDSMPMKGAMQPQQAGSNILSMTPQGQAMAALKPQGLAEGGSAKSIDEMKAELAAKKDPSTEKRVTVAASGAGGVKGIVVPKHLIEGNPKAGAEGLKNMMDARAKVYGEEHREPLNLGQVGKIHKQTLEEHFAKPLAEQKSAEQEALNKIRSAKFIKHNKDTLDESEKLDTVEHEHDEEGRSHVGYASKGIAGHALFPKGHGKDMDYKVINTCPGQTEGCGGGKSAEGIVDTKQGTCFAPNAESQYAAAVSRRAGHAIAKHDPAMTKDWIIAHTGSMRNAANRADKQNKRMLYRPNVVDETDVSSRHVIRHLNEQRKMDDKPPIIANSYGKTNELHDPENGYHVTHSNVGPKVKKGQEITENVARDKARVRNTVMAADNHGDFKNEQGNKTPPKGSYMVTDVKRGSPMAKSMEKAITHAKYWSTGRSEKDLTPEEREEGPEGHFGGNGKPTTPDKAHYGHTTHEGLRYDYQKQHILHPRLVQVGKNDDGTPHMIPTDSRFKDTEFLPKNRFKTKNGKEAGHILMTTPTESTSNIGHQTSFTHNVSPSHIEHAEKNNGEYEIDKPEDQAKAKGKEYAAPQVMKFQPKPKAYAGGGSVGGRHIGFSDDDFHAFPEQNVVAQRHLAMRGDDHEPVAKHGLLNTKRKVTMNKDMDTMLLELTRNKKAK